MQYIQQINFTCSEYQQSVQVDVDEAKEEQGFSSPNCFTTTIINTRAVSPALEELERTVAMIRPLKPQKQPKIDISKKMQH